MKITAIVPAAGKGKRLKAKISKLFFPVNGRPLLAHTLMNLKRCFSFDEIILAAPPMQFKKMRVLLKKYGIGGVKIISGGATRAASVKNAILKVSKKSDWVLVHDAARPLVSAKLVRKTIAAAKKTGAAICSLPAAATVKKIDNRSKMVFRTEDRDTLVLAQTPQVFRKNLLLKRYQALGKKTLLCTDEAALFDGSRVKVQVVDGEARNIKITTPEDIKLLKFYLEN